MPSRRTSFWGLCRRFSPPHSSRRSGLPSRRSTARSWRRWNMNRPSPFITKARRSRTHTRHRLYRILCVGLVLFVSPGYTSTGVVHAADDARTIVAEAQRRTDAASQRYEGLLQVFDARGKVSDKRWTFDRLGSHGRSKAVLRFIAPPEVKGVALLVVNHADRASDQWMWTPAIERDRRIALQDRSTRFFGTDFSFEDLEERDVDQYDYALLGDETIDDAPAWKIQSTPKQSKSSQYT